jgi:hypothetical protein
MLTGFLDVIVRFGYLPSTFTDFEGELALSFRKVAVPPPPPPPPPPSPPSPQSEDRAWGWKEEGEGTRKGATKNCWARLIE